MFLTHNKKINNSLHLQMLCVSKVSVVLVLGVCVLQLLTATESAVAVQQCHTEIWRASFLLFMSLAKESIHYVQLYLMTPCICSIYTCSETYISIRKTCPRNEYPLKPHFYIEKLGFAGINLLFLFLTQNIDCGYSRRF